MPPLDIKWIYSRGGNLGDIELYAPNKNIAALTLLAYGFLYVDLNKLVPATPDLHKELDS